MSLGQVISYGQHDTESFVVATAHGPGKLDPLDAYDSESMETIMQVCEGLFRYNYSSSEMESIPCLADGMGSWSPDIKNFTIALKQEVTFHDGSKFNASAVKWNFDRLQYWTYGFDVDDDGDLDTHPLGTASKTLFAHSGTPILNHTEIIDEYTVKFVLNLQSVIWEKLLAFIACAIVLPDPNYEQGSYFFNRIDINDELIGTGPFMLTEYTFDEQVVFNFYPEYHIPWGKDHIKKMIYRIIPDSVFFSLAVLNHEVHWGGVSGYYQEIFEEDPALIRIKKKAPVVYYIQMNLYNMPLEVRYASSFVWNHTQWLEETLGGYHYELHVPIPDGMEYHHTGFEGEPYFNVTKARSIILEATSPELALNVTASGLSIFNSTSEWRAVAESTTPLANFNFTQEYESNLIDLAALQLQDNLKDIGIHLEIMKGRWTCCGWSSGWICDMVCDYLENPNSHHRLAYSFGGWGPDYNDPINMIEPLYGTNASSNCFGLVNDTWNQMLLDTYNLTGNARRDKFYEIQEHFVKYQAPTIYILQLGKSINFNREFLDEDSIGDLLNIFSDYYWVNVRFTPPSRSIPGIPITGFVISIVAACGFVVYIIRPYRNQNSSTKK